MDQRINVMIQECAKSHMYINLHGDNPAQVIAIVELQDGVDIEYLNDLKATIGGRVEPYWYGSRPTRWYISTYEDYELFHSLERELSKRVGIGGVTKRYIALSEAMYKYRKVRAFEK